MQAAAPPAAEGAPAEGAAAAGRVRYWRVRQGVAQPVHEHAIHQASRAWLPGRLYGTL